MRPAACLNGFECDVKLDTKDPAVNLAQSNVKGMKEMLYPSSSSLSSLSGHFYAFLFPLYIVPSKLHHV